MALVIQTLYYTIHQYIAQEFRHSLMEVAQFLKFGIGDGQIWCAAVAPPQHIHEYGKSCLEYCQETGLGNSS